MSDNTLIYQPWGKAMAARISTLMLMIFFLAACSAKKEKIPVKLKLFQSNMIAALNLSGGIVVVGKGETEADQFRFAIADADQNITLDLKKGKWEFIAVGWAGTSGPFTGDNKCAYSGVVDLKDAEATVNLSLTLANCLKPFASNVFADTSAQRADGKFFKVKPVVCYNSVLNPANCPSGINLSQFVSYKTVIKSHLGGVANTVLPSMSSACHLLSSSAAQSLPVFPATQSFDLGVELQFFTSTSCTGTAKKFDFAKGFMAPTLTNDLTAYSADSTTEQFKLFINPGAGTTFVSNVKINNNAVGTTSSSVSVSFDPLPSAAVDICLSEINNGAACSPWINSTSSPQTYSVGAGDGSKSIYLFARTADSHVFSIGQDSILLDTSPPVAGPAPTYNTAYSSGSVNLNWSFSDVSALQYDLKICPDISCSTSCTTEGTNLTSPNLNWTLSGADGSKFVCVRATDALGQSSAYFNLGSFNYDSVAPSPGVLSINSNATYSTSLTVSYSSSAAGADFICLNETNSSASCSWNAYSASGPYTFSAGEGIRTLHAFFKDQAGNISQANSSITIDTSVPTPPGVATLNAYYSVAPFAANWGDSSDAHLSHYQVKVCASSACSISCGTPTSTVGTVASESIQTTHGIQEGTNYLCINAVDLAGHNSGYTSVGSFTFDSVPPVAGTILLNNGDDYTNNPTVTWQASGHTGSPTHMCIRGTNSSTGCTWNAVSSSGPYTLSAGEGVKYTYLFYKDAAGNISASVNDSITLDQTAPIAISFTSPNGVTELEDNKVDIAISGGTDGGFPVTYTYKLCNNASCSVTTHTSQNSSSQTITLSKPSTWAVNEVNYVQVVSTDRAGNTVSASSGNITRKIKKRVKDISVGLTHSCVVVSTGEVKCWGQNNYGQLGIGNTTNIGTGPMQMGDYLASVAGLPPVKKVSAGQYYTCALTIDGLVYCWGEGTFGKLGQENLSQQVLPQLVDIGAGVKAIDISAKYNHTCVITSAGDVKCWGVNTSGQLGIGSTAAVGDGAGEMGSGLQSVNLDPAYKAIKVSVGGSSTCALLSNRTIKCWGYYAHLGQSMSSGTVGTTSSTEVNSLTPINFGTDHAIDIQSGVDFHCALFANGKIKCWGANDKGQLGVGVSNANLYGTLSTPLPASYVNLGSQLATKIIAGEKSMCAILDNGLTKCWGENTSGIIGQGTTITNFPDPTTVINLNLGTNQFARELALSKDSGCAILDNGQVKCWGLSTKMGMGSSGSGGLFNYGDDNFEMGDSLPIVDFGYANKIDVMKITSGSEHACALLYNGKMKCWGSNAYGQIGGNMLGGDKGHLPSDMGDNLKYLDLGKSIRDIEGSGWGVYHTCALLVDGDLKCFGRNHSGQLGISSIISPNDAIGDQTGEVSPSLPAVNFSGRKVKAVATGTMHTCALTSDGKIFCFGENSDSQLGTDDNFDLLQPGSEAVLDLAVQITVGSQHSCAILQNGQAKCWGGNLQGQLGLNSITLHGNGDMASLPAVDLGTIERPIKIAAGNTSTCALLQNRNVKCWGRNDFGQVGINGSNPTYGSGSPTLQSQSIVYFESTAAASLATDIVMGGDVACALKADGLMKCWGKNSEGQVGQNSNQPLFGDGSYPITGLGNIFAAPNFTEKITAGENVCRISSGGRPLCWGSNSAGQVGQGTNDIEFGTAVVGVPLAPIEL